MPKNQNNKQSVLFFDGWENMYTQKDLRKGFSGEYFRFWCPNEDTLVVFNFFRISNKWECRILHLQFREPDDNTFIVTQRVLTNRLPASGWDKFITHLKNIGLDSLRGYEAIPDFHQSTHCDVVTIEYCKDANYRIFDLTCADQNKEKFTDSLKPLLNLACLLEKEFGTYYFHVPKSWFSKQ